MQTFEAGSNQGVEPNHQTDLGQVQAGIRAVS